MQQGTMKEWKQKKILTGEVKANSSLPEAVPKGKTWNLAIKDNKRMKIKKNNHKIFTGEVKVICIQVYQELYLKKFKI